MMERCARSEKEERRHCAVFSLVGVKQSHINPHYLVLCQTAEGQS